MAGNDGNKKGDTEDFDFASEFANLDWTNDDDKADGGKSNEGGFGGDDEFGDSESFLSLEQMPDADGTDAFADLGSGDEFGDAGSEDDSAAYQAFEDQGAIDTGTVIGADSGFEDTDAEDPYATTYGSPAKATAPAAAEEDDVDPFAEEPPEEDDVAPAPAAARPPVAKWLMAAAAVVVVAGTSYFVVPSLLGGGQTDVQLAQVKPTSQDEASFPTSLPAQPQAGKPSAVLPAAEQPTAGQQTAQVQPPVLGQPEATVPAITLPSADPAPSLDPIKLPSADPAPATAAQPAALPAADPAPAKADPLDGMVGGTQRGGIDAMREPEAKPAVSATAQKPVANADEIAALESRLEALEGKVGKLADSFDNFVEARSKDTQAVPEAKPVKEVSPSASSVSGIPPMKPPIIESSSLKGVAGDVAWVSTNSGVVEVRVGDDVPGAGKVESFRFYRGSWILVTTEGLIVRQ